MGLAASLNAAILETIPGAMDQLGQRVVAHIKDEISGSPGSKPGNPPGKISGKLLEGISYSVSGNEVTIVSQDPTSSLLEYGTVNMAARPFMAPGITYAHEILPEIFQEALRNG